MSAPTTDAAPPVVTVDGSSTVGQSSSAASSAGGSSTVVAPSSSSTAPVRPPARPSRSKLDLEPNPFEQSFSGKSPSAEEQDSKEGILDVKVIVDGADGPGEGTTGALVGEVNGDLKPMVLPSVSQLVSPETEESAFNWNNMINTPAISSLRSGPLSPAMLTGPKAASQGQAAVISHALQFDTNSFVRTGLTPGTGLTPLSGGPASFPPPSPNTAAFLAMVTNATAAAGQTGPDGLPLPLSPGTFNNVMNSLNANANASGQQGHQPHPLANSHLVGGPSGGGQPDYFSHRPDDGQGTHVQQQQQQQEQHQHQQNQQDQHSMMASQHRQQQYQQQQQQHQMNGQQFAPQPYNGQLQQQQHQQQQQQQQQQGGPPEQYHKQTAAAASQAANGLFLLTQAHQEIAAREHASPASSNGMNGPHHGQPQAHQLQQQQQPLSHLPPNSTHPGAAPLVPPPSTRAGKRKSSGPIETAAAPAPKKNARAPAAGGAAAKRGKKPASVESDDGYPDMEAVSPEMGGGSQDGGNGLGPDGKPETEEEKRKNFLERNRQAALKCRQRKKAWLGQLQAKVEYLQGENEGLQQTIGSLRDEVARLQGALGGGQASSAPNGSGPVYVNGNGQAQQLNGGGPQQAGARRGGPAGGF